MSKRCLSGINGAKTRLFLGANIGSDHDLLMMIMKVKLTRRQRQNQAKLRYDIEKLKDSAMLDEFRVTLGGKFCTITFIQVR